MEDMEAEEGPAAMEEEQQEEGEKEETENATNKQTNKLTEQAEEGKEKEDESEEAMDVENKVLLFHVDCRLISPGMLLYRGKFSKISRYRDKPK